MKPQSILSALTLLTLSTASPLRNRIYARQSNSTNTTATCLDITTATEIVSQFSSLLTAYNPTVASSLLSSTAFTDTSDSINFLGGYPLGGPTFNSSQAFMMGQGSQPPMGLNVTNIDAVTCEGVIVFRWSGEVGCRLATVKGIDILYASNDPSVGGGSTANGTTAGVGGWVITQVYSEFNSAAWSKNIGGGCSPPSWGPGSNQTWGPPSGSNQTWGPPSNQTWGSLNRR